MRKSIIGLSILFFTLSGIITFKALEIPVKNAHYQNASIESKLKDSLHKSEDMLEKSDKEQVTDSDVTEELQTTVDRLEDKLSNKNEETQENIKTDKSEDKARVLAVLGSEVFRTGQVFYEETLMSAVNKIIPEILAYPGHRVIIEGHTDNIPVQVSAGKRYRDNRELSLLRAKAVANVLEKKGISPEQISVIGYGDTRPLVSNDTYGGRVKNRRVEIKLIPAEKEF